ncbi:helix-turn-helix domain-containing protein [Endozoicomonas sp. ALB091]|uniref:helix-turn-helix domain-containing protein n=1 Tax=Endozoicomonas sp. ALB091 TaxID=3403073 RepID=UPI003BB5B5A1
MNHPEVAERFKLAMELAGIKTVTKLAWKSGVERAYIYRLLSGDIAKPHKYLEPLSKALGVDPNWLGNGKGGIYDFERPSLKKGVIKTTVTVVPLEGSPFEAELMVPDIFNSLRHVPQEPNLYAYFYLPETNNYFPANTLLTVEVIFRPGPGMFLAWYESGGMKQLGCFNRYYDQSGEKSNAQDGMEVIGRIRNMDYWKMDDLV